MNNNHKTLILFPQDLTTKFLEEIVSHLLQTVNSSIFTVTRIESSDGSHQSSLVQIRDPIYNTIIFLGHGNSISLCGAYIGNYRREKFISVKDFGVFESKRIILLSCDSCNLIKKGKAYGSYEAIGFGDLPTDWNDIQSAREANVNAYCGFTENTIQSFRTCLVEIMKYSLSDFLNNNLSLAEMYNLIYLRINKRIAKYFLDNRKVNLPLSDALFQMKHEIHLNNNKRL